MQASKRSCFALSISRFCKVLNYKYMKRYNSSRYKICRLKKWDMVELEFRGKTLGNPFADYNIQAADCFFDLNGCPKSCSKAYLF